VRRPDLPLIVTATEFSMSEAHNDSSDTRAPGVFDRSPDLGSAQATLVVGSIFIVVVGAVMLAGGLYRRFPIPMALFTLAAIIAGVWAIS
jgi:hypothetical protein